MQHLIGEEKERTLVRAVLSLFLLVTKRLYGKEWEWSIGQIKTCRKKQHVEIDDRKEMPDLFCGKAAVGGNYNLMRDSYVLRTPTILQNIRISWCLRPTFKLIFWRVSRTFTHI